VAALLRRPDEGEMLASSRVDPAHLHVNKVVGRGTFGVVVSVTDERADRRFAVKKVAREDVREGGAKVRRQAIAERDALASVRHPCVCAFEGTYKTALALYYVLELCDGPELYDVLQERGTMGEAEVALYVACVVGGLSALHERGWVYRDVKAENLIFASTGALKLVDFGLAKWLGAGGRTYTVCGTTEYMSPEVVDGCGYDRSADWWAVGCVAYECAHGFTPWRLGDDGEPNYGLTDTRITKHIVDEGRPLAFPDSEEPPSQRLRALLGGLLTRPPARRLGGTNAGAAAVRAHPFFAAIDWAALDAGTLPMPPAPTVARRSSRRSRALDDEPDDDDDDDDDSSADGPPVDALSAQLLAFAQKQREPAPPEEAPASPRGSNGVPELASVETPPALFGWTSNPNMVPTATRTHAATTQPCACR
jgi:serine/threonine protein kinase